jgi:hypothetical protein
MTYYRANVPRFVDETVDGEALIMDMVSGTYYSCVGASTFAWDALKRGVPADEVARAVAVAYGISADRALDDMAIFVSQLLDEQALVTADDGPATLDEHFDAAEDYQPLRLERYTDLADLILLDPVHDVSDAGWPSEQG